MWKKWGAKRKEGGISDGEGAPAAKRAARTEGGDDDDCFAAQLSKNRKVSVRIFAGRPMVDFREFYFKDGRELPTKKGISLSMDQWNILRDNIEEIDQALEKN